ncbi:MAG: ABC transporter, substrate-binding protein (cluster 1, maltose/g3p/polyamine/iron), partial [uncultured Rubrobacteraceae bacterium]
GRGTSGSPQVDEATVPGSGCRGGSVRGRVWRGAAEQPGRAGGRRWRRREDVRRPKRRARVLERVHRRRRAVHEPTRRRLYGRTRQYRGQDEHHRVGGLLREDSVCGAERRGARPGDHAQR